MPPNPGNAFVGHSGDIGKSLAVRLSAGFGRHRRGATGWQNIRQLSNLEKRRARPDILVALSGFLQRQ